MSDKNLTEAEWRKFSKGRGLKDAPLLKALTDLERAPKQGPAAELDALAEVEKQADALRKANKADKELGSYLDDLDKALTKARKLAEGAVKKSESEGDDEEDSPALLTTKLLPLVRMVRKGETMQVKLAITGKEVAVMMARRSISPARNKLLSEYLGVSGGVKFVSGECLLEENALTFVVQSQAAGLAKKLRAALLKQVELRLKVRVRGENPDDIDEDGEGEETEGEVTEDKLSTPTREEKSSDQRSYEQRLATLEPVYLQALRDQTGDASKLRAVDAFVREKAAAGQYGSALKGLDSLEKLLTTTTTPPPAPPPPPPPPQGDSPNPTTDEGTAAFNARLAALMPRIKTALTDNGPHAQDLKLKVSEAGVFARKKEFDAANHLLDEAEQLLGDDADPGKAFNTRLSALLPQVKEAIASGSEHATDIRAKVTDAGNLARNKDLAGANRTLDEVEALLKQAQTPGQKEEATTEQSDEDNTGKNDAASWEKRRAALEPNYLAALKNRPEEATRIRATWGMSDDQAEAGNFEAALDLLKRLETLLKTQTAEKGGGYTGIADYRKTLLDLRSAVTKVEQQIASLLDTLPDQMPEEADLAEALAEDLSASTAALQSLIDDAMGSAENEDSPITRELTSRLDGMIDEVANNEVIQHMDTNVFGVQVSIAATLGKALSDVRAALPVPG